MPELMSVMNPQTTKVTIKELFNSGMFRDIYGEAKNRKKGGVHQ